MGRSQVKYRATHGRGRGRGRGESAGGRGGASGRGRPSHLRSLGSNAFRFEEREEAQDDAQQTQQEGDYGGRTQFFASEQNYREQMGAAPGEYFQSRAMKQWEEKDDAADDQAAVGVLDLDWIASQLALVPPDARYRIDPKYCIDLPFEPQDEEESGAEEEVASEQVNTAKTAAPVAAPSTAAPTPPKSAQGDAELDFLLNLSASTSTMAKSAPAPVAPAVTAPAPTRTPAETEQLEEWLDDVLDM
ncbi:hypothetical protein PHYSODRAFT_492024 [Phytophthora sojae]|uniref:Uncharacterized protein n=1 Tax=Phytophthora sojae (strain P6497) TaxID=1094619 RepID=G4Z2L5_PHYSP|nr:hypothetical protein PHYSODRAFT_492024 [Phytophthora sojae]EGZ21444.1 hypothetical protein PHYSODRAFT_492024 [Phytophthora sojae]|eukprot:XP_009524161.1 hypothetical protein PHYSODRAFT_492024 [Phytophthora sojae]